MPRQGFYEEEDAYKQFLGQSFQQYFITKRWLAGFCCEANVEAGLFERCVRHCGFYWGEDSATAMTGKGPKTGCKCKITCWFMAIIGHQNAHSRRSHHFGDRFLRWSWLFPGFSDRQWVLVRVKLVVKIKLSTGSDLTGEPTATASSSASRVAAG